MDYTTVLDISHNIQINLNNMRDMHNDFKKCSIIWRHNDDFDYDIFILLNYIQEYMEKILISLRSKLKSYDDEQLQGNYIYKNLPSVPQRLIASYGYKKPTLTDFIDEISDVRNYDIDRPQESRYCAVFNIIRNGFLISTGHKFESDLISKNPVKWEYEYDLFYAWLKRIDRLEYSTTLTHRVAFIILQRGKIATILSAYIRIDFPLKPSRIFLSLTHGYGDFPVNNRILSTKLWKRNKTVIVCVYNEKISEIKVYSPTIYILAKNIISRIPGFYNRILIENLSIVSVYEVYNQRNKYVVLFKTPSLKKDITPFVNFN